MTDEEKDKTEKEYKEWLVNDHKLLDNPTYYDIEQKCFRAFFAGTRYGLTEGRKEKELSYRVGKVTKAELNKCKTIEEKMEWLGKVLGYAIFKNDISYAVWVNVQKNNIIENLEKENEALRQSEQESQEIIAELNAKLKNIDHYLAYDIPHELMNEATTKIWHML